MAREITSLIPGKTYASPENCRKAVDKIYGNDDRLRYLIVYNDNGRCFPLFIGEYALQRGVHFSQFCVVS
jgi:hypothetical protein